jgi:hypothetical protein
VVTLGTQVGSRSQLKPAIKVLVTSHLRGFGVAIAVAVECFEPAIQITLRRPKPAADGKAVIASAAGATIAAERDSHQETTTTASDDLSKFSGQALPFLWSASLCKSGGRATIRILGSCLDRCCWRFDCGVRQFSDLLPPAKNRVNIGFDRLCVIGVDHLEPFLEEKIMEATNQKLSPDRSQHLTAR